MTVLCSPAEPADIRAYFETSSAPETLGVDFMFSNGEIMIGIQRKRFPDDFLASLRDDRIAKELGQMLTLGARILILEGIPRWTETGGERYLHGIRTKFSESQLWGVLASLQHLHDVQIYWTDDHAGTVRLVKRLEKWYVNAKGKTAETSSLRKRNTPPKDDWGKRGSSDWCLWILQSFPGVGPKVAKAVYKHFGYLPLTWTVTEDELLEVPGVGKKIAKAFIATLDTSEIENG